MKFIPLTNSDEKAIVDDEDYEWLAQFKWHYHDGYVRTYMNGMPVYMHNLIYAVMEYQKENMEFWYASPRTGG